MKNLATLLVGYLLIGLSAVLLVLPQLAATPKQSAPSTSAAQTTEPVPAFHAQPPSGQLPDTMEPSLFQDKLIFNAYAIAGRIRKVLYQEPCYCHCDRSAGHGSLLDCFVSRHGSGCDLCMREAFYSYEQTRRGKSPLQIREGIMRGDWQTIQIAKYQKDYLPPR
jgi:uncharacterized protein with PCYCGC motif